MTELVITNIPDTWINNASGRTGTNYKSSGLTRVQSGEQRTVLLPDLGSISGRTVLDAYLVGHAKSFGAQTLTVTPLSERWTPGRVTWANQPAANSAAAVSAALGAVADGDVVEVPGLAAMVQAVADGTDWFGVRVTTNAVTSQTFYATNSGEPAWELHVTLSDVAEAPTGLRPDGGADQGSLSPILAWEPVDGQTNLRVQVDTPAAGADPDEVAPDYDSTLVAGGDPEFDLTGEHALTGSGPHFWRVKVTTEDASEDGEWSDWAEFGYRVMPEFVLDSPTGPFGDVQPTIIGHMTGETMRWWKLTVTGPSRADVRYRTGLRKGAMEVTLPLRNKEGRRVLKEGRDAWLHVQAGGQFERAVAVGQPGYVNEWYLLQLSDDDTAVDKATNLRVFQYADGDPRLVWQWDRTEAADEYRPRVDGVTVEIVEDEDVEVNAGTYTYVDRGEVAPMRVHELSLKVKDGEDVSGPTRLDDHSHQVKGVWLIPETGQPIQLAGTAVGDFSRADSVATYTTLPGEQVDVFYGHPGITGTFQGFLDSRTPDLWDTIEQVKDLARRRRRQVRMVWGSESMLVNLRNVSVVPADDILPSNLLHNVRFEFTQVDDD